MASDMKSLFGEMLLTDCIDENPNAPNLPSPEVSLETHDTNFFNICCDNSPHIHSCCYTGFEVQNSHQDYKVSLSKEHGPRS